jgi:DNA processing protein
VVTSGLAKGIDAASHEGALAAGGRSIAVCGTGLDRVYPAAHLELAARIAAQGACVSEFPPGTAAIAANFPRRNRIISGLARGTLVVEAARDSGSLITARRALEQGREVFAIPGSIQSPLSAGCHELIRDGARLVSHPGEVVSELGIPIEKITLSKQLLTIAPDPPDAGHPLDKAAEMLLDALGFEPASIDDLVDRTGLTPGSLASVLLILELDRRIEPRPGGLFCRVR